MMFDTLTQFINRAWVLDLFGGSGAFAFEALSRGAASAVIAELDRQAYDVILKNAAALGLSERCTCRHMDAMQLIELLAVQRQRFDLIFIAPPFYKDLYAPTLARLTQFPVYHENSIIVIHSEKKHDPAAGQGFFEIVKEKKDGTNKLTFLRPVQ